MACSLHVDREAIPGIEEVFSLHLIDETINISAKLESTCILFVNMLSLKTRRSVLLISTDRLVFYRLITEEIVRDV